MAYRKEIIVLTGSRFKGVVKLQSNLHSINKLKGSCNIEFNPNSATLYIMAGTQISEIPLANHNTAFEIPQTESEEISCVILSENPPMFGSTKNNVDRSKAVALVENWIKDKSKKEKEREESIKESDDETIQKEINLDDDETLSVKHKEDIIKQSMGVNEEIDKKDKQDVNFQLVDDEPIQNLNEPIEVEFEKPKESFSDAKTSYFKEGVNDKKFDFDKYKADTQKSDDVAADKINQGNIFGEGVQYDGSNFYNAIKPQIDEMFVCYPLEEILESIVENSKWVKIKADDSYYVVGLIFDGSTPEYICYGIPSSYKVKPPKDIEDVCVWLPVDKENKQSEGYWVIYQSAKNGTIVV